MTTDPEELDPELDVELGGGDDMDEDLDEDLDGFVVVGEDEDADASDDSESDSDGDDDDEADDAGAGVRVVEAAAEEESDGFEEDIAPVVRVPDEEDDAPARRDGEFVCTRCFLVKRESQLAIRSRKVCRDCA